MNDQEPNRPALKFSSRFLELTENFKFDLELDSVGRLTGYIEKEVAGRIEKILPGILKESGCDAECVRVMMNAVVRRDFSEIDVSGNEDKMMMALGLSLTAERARTHLLTVVLERQEPARLAEIGMSPEARDIVINFLRDFPVVNAEFIRFKSMAMTGRKCAEQPPEAEQDSIRVARCLERVCEKLSKKNAKKIFGESGEDFASYLKILAASYRPPIAAGEPKARAAKKAFTNFIKKYPAHPLIVVPKMDNYIPVKNNINLGWDPELRVLWQSPKHRRISENLQSGCGVFVESAKRQFPDDVSAKNAGRLKKFQPIVCDELGSFGVNMTFRAEAFVQGNSFLLIRNCEEVELVAPLVEKIQEKFGHDWDSIITSRKFFEYVECQLMNHELGHKIYGDTRETARIFGADTHIKIEEHKADVLSAATLPDTLMVRAGQDFPGQERQAVNLAILGNALTCAELSPDSELGAYHQSAVATLNGLNEAGLLKFDKSNGQIDKKILERDLSKDFFSTRAREVLSLYRTARAGVKKAKTESRQKAKFLMEQKLTAA